jgi:nucleoside-diphosphate-sugar epimerase
MILVTGATGTVGSEVVAALHPGDPGRVRALTRNPDAVFAVGVERVVADLGDSDLTSALDGVDAVFLLAADREAVRSQRRTWFHRPDHQLASGG